jgi:hypothetical protein
MKKVIRLTESDLVRIVKRVISEQKTTLNEGVGTMAAKKLYDALSGHFLDDKEGEALTAIKMVKNCQDLKELLTGIRKLSGMSLHEYIDDQMSAVDTEYDQITEYIYNIQNKCGKTGSFDDGYNSWNHMLKWLSGRGYTISY